MKARRSRRARRAGFTLLELMVALAIGALVVATMYTLSGSSARAFQTQQRISQLQLSTRLAMERLRRDIGAAGFGGTPDSLAERTCGSRGIATQMVAVGLDDHDATATTALGTMAGAAQAATHADRLRLLGNFATSDTYLIANTGTANGSSILIQSNWQAFRRSFAADPLGTTFDTALFSQVFAPGRVLHVTHPRGYHFFTRVTSSSVTSSGSTPLVSLSLPLPALDECNFALCVGCQVTPLQMFEYGIDTAANIAPALAPNDPGVVGTNTILYRRELDPETLDPLADTLPTAVLEYAVNFDVAITYDTAIAGNPPNLATVAFLPDPASQSRRVRALRVELSGRTPDIDPNYPWPYAGTRGATQPLTAFRVFTDRPGAARVRTAVAEFVLENLALRGM